jgi:hypothetical protein
MVMHRLHASNKDRWVEEEADPIIWRNLFMPGREHLHHPHLGNWEIGGLLFSFKGGKLNVLTLDERDLDIRSFRER